MKEFEVNTKPKTIEEKNNLVSNIPLTRLPHMKFTYKQSGHFPKICGIGEIFLDGENGKNEIDVWIPKLAHQVLCMNGKTSTFFGKVVIPYGSHSLYTDKEYIEFKEIHKAKLESDFSLGYLVLVYEKKSQKFYQLFLKGGMVDIGGKIIASMLEGNNYFSITSKENGKYIDVQVKNIKNFEKPTVSSINYAEAVKLLLTYTMDTQNEGAVVSGR